MFESIRTSSPREKIACQIVGWSRIWIRQRLHSDVARITDLYGAARSRLNGHVFEYDCSRVGNQKRRQRRPLASMMARTLVSCPQPWMRDVLLSQSITTLSS